jgi:arabinogalactan endo-1,4-beta-galactosidase
MARLSLLVGLFFLFCMAKCKSECDCLPPPGPSLLPVAIKGADISWLPEIRQFGFNLKNAAGAVEDPLLTLKNAGVNTIRLRLWHSPTNLTSSFEQVKQLALQCKQQGFNILLSVHFSDTWADPGQQSIPAAWSGLNFNTLKDSVFNYVKKCMQQINPEYIQIGNEINAGLLWPMGNASNPTQFKELIRTGISAVRSESASAKIILHCAGYTQASWLFNQFLGLDYDIIGLSYYPLWHGKDLFDLQSQMNQLQRQFNKSTLIVETSYPFTLQWNDFTNNIVGLTNQLIPEYTATNEGQKSFVSAIRNLAATSNQCLGFCYWGGEWVSYKGNTATNASTWENQAFWDFNQQALPVLEAYK